MKPLDRLFHWLRAREVRPYIRQGARVLDIGCGDGLFLAQLGNRIQDSIGIDPDISAAVARGAYRLIAGRVPGDVPTSCGPFDVITMLALLEHLPPPEQRGLAQACLSLLVPGGYLVLTVPSPAVDGILHWLQRIPGLCQGMHVDEHYGFKVEQTPAIFSAFRLVKAKSFELGLNNLFVFQAPARSRS
jgi:2-polyprenyl-3-methyl-5-hydroxy-6-metoxy-1,4-benzoquinol methylase